MDRQTLPTDLRWIASRLREAAAVVETLPEEERKAAPAVQALQMGKWSGQMDRWAAILDDFTDSHLGRGEGRSV